MDNEAVMTKAGLESLRKELDELETVARAEIAAQIKTAREWGDLKENAEYHEAKRAQAHLETKILQLRDQLQNAKVVEVAASTDEVAFGSTVEVEDDNGRKLTYTLVSQREAAPSEGKI